MNKLDLYGSPKLGGTPITDVEEHAIISNVAGKKVFNIDSTGNLVNPSTSENQVDIIKILQENGVRLSPEVLVLLQAIANPAYVDKSANQIRSQVTGSLSTVTTVTNLTNFGTFPADHLQNLMSRNAWANSIRGLIT